MSMGICDCLKGLCYLFCIVFCGVFICKCIGVYVHEFELHVVGFCVGVFVVLCGGKGVLRWCYFALLCFISSVYVLLRILV